MRFTLVITFLSIIFFNGCNEKVTENNYASFKKDFIYENQDIELLQRVLDYWYLRSTHEFKESYKYELPYQRYLKDFKLYANEGASIYRDFYTTITDVKYIHNNTIAIVNRVYKRKKITLSQKSKWIKVNNLWYHKYDYTVFPEGR
jgi:hypothetical protein